MKQGKLWTRDEVLLALNLYYKIPFGQFHQHSPQVIDLAKLIGRTPSSIAMRLSNFASLDLYHQNRGVSGLSSYSKLVAEVWAEAQNNWESLILTSEALLESFPVSQYDAVVADYPRAKAYQPPQEKQEVPTETEGSAKVRLGQRFFRGSIMANYREQCCVCGMPLPELLIASHIIPWKDREDLRLNPSNGLCLCVLHDKAFDRGFLSVDTDYKVLISPSIHDYSAQEAVKTGLIAYENHPIILPDRFSPDKRFLAFHRQEYFIQ